jgi:hypothetical protein
MKSSLALLFPLVSFAAVVPATEEPINTLYHGYDRFTLPPNLAEIVGMFQCSYFE